MNTLHKTNVKENSNEQYFRFLVYQGDFDSTGNFKKSKCVGMAYSKEGQSMMTLKLWTFVNEKFYLILNQQDASRYLIMTREPNKNPKSKNKYYWNIVGNGEIHSAMGLVSLKFDLFDQPIFMSTHPEASAYSTTLQNPEDVTHE